MLDKTEITSEHLNTPKPAQQHLNSSPMITGALPGTSVRWLHVLYQELLWDDVLQLKNKNLLSYRDFLV